MARRRSKKSSGLEELSKLPWWISVALATIIFISLKVILPSIEIQGSIGKGIQSALPNLTWFFVALFLVAALISAFREIKEKRNAVKNTGSKNKQGVIAVEMPEPSKPRHRKEVVAMLMDEIAVPEHATSSEKPSAWTQELLGQLEWKRFEELCRAYFEAKGYVSKTTRTGADGGVDINLYKGKSEKPAVLVQCKAWNTYKVGVKPVRELFGVMAASGVSKGVFMTTGKFTDEAKSFAKGKKVVLGTGSSLFQSIKGMPEETQATLLEVATEGAYTTPTCASCDIKMIIRTIKKGKNAGDGFWGCTNYPRCKNTLKYT